MLFDFCNPSSSSMDASEICNLDFFNMVAATVAIIFSGIAIAYVASTYKTIWTQLFVLHHLRSSMVLCLLFVNICEVAASCLLVNPPTGHTTSPMALISAALLLVATIVVAVFVRVIEIRDRSDWLSVAIAVELFQFVSKILKWKRLTKTMAVTNLLPVLTLASAVLMGLLMTLDSLTLYLESRPVRKQKSTTSSSNENIGYKHPKSTFYSKITFWWLTPLLWRGYWLPLELEDLGSLYEKDTSRYQYDQFLFIYQSFKNKQASLWLCYFKSCWRMFAVGGILKFLGDLTGLVGPLSIAYIVEYIEQKSTKSNNSLPNANISNLQPILTGTLDSDNTIYDTAADYFDENGLTNQIYAPDWHDFVTNGWIICVLVLIASLAQGTFSQTSTHLVNLEGIRLKNALQGLVYRKTLSLNLNNSANVAQSSGSQRRKSSANNSSDHKSGDKNCQKHGVNGLQNHRQQMTRADGSNTTPLRQPNGNDNGNDNHVDGGNNDEMQMQDAGTITNLMSEDTFNVMSFFWIAHYVWAIPLKVGVVMYLLYQKLGISAIYGSIICISVMTPLQFLIGKAMSKNLKTASEYTDERLKKINEVLLGIKLIKLNAWEKVFKEKINESRSRELKYLDLDSLFWTLMTFLAHVSTILVTFVTFTIFSNIEQDTITFNASRVFSSLALFNQLTVPLFIFPITVPIIIQAVVSTKRLENFLSQLEVQKEFEGVRNMARILCKSDASLDIYENEQQPPPSSVAKKKIENEKPTLNDTKVCDAQNKAIINDAATVSECEGKQDNIEGRAMQSQTVVGPITVTDGGETVIDAVISAPDVTTGATKAVPSKNIKLKKSSQLKANTKVEKLRLQLQQLPLVVGVAKEIQQLPVLGDDAVVCVQNGVFAWHKSDTDKELRVQNLQIPRGKLTVIVGKNGSGKSSLLAALLKEMHNVSGDVIWNKFSTIAYVTQTPWLMGTTIRENILFGESYRPKRYERVLEACALKPDLELMPAGDLTEIGGNGINLSGGQKQRIAVARAVYSSGNVVILDDPFSSLDNEVGNYVFENCINKMLLKQKRTTILVTQKLQLVFRADKIIALENNAIRANGTLADVELSNPDLITEWKSIISKENTKETQLSSGRTARERWKLFKNISRLGLQRINITEDDHLSSMQPVFKPSKRSSGLFGSHYLTHDLQLPIDECYNEDFEIRRRRSKRHRQCTSLEIRDLNKSGQPVYRVNSLQLQEGTAAHAKTPVARYVSSPITLKKDLPLNLAKEECDNLSNSSRISFRKFLRQMSTRQQRRPSSVSANIADIFREKQKIHTRNSITSIDEENFAHAPAKRLISSVSKYSEETEDEIGTSYNEEVSNRLIYDEERKYGTIPTRIYLLYLKSCGLYTVTIFFLSALGWQALRVYTDIWLRDWTEIDVKNESGLVSYYFKIYGVLSGLCILLAMISTPAGQIAGSNARNVLHNQLIDSILKNSLHFFQTVPLGRIMNRFSSDMTVIDKKIAATSQRLLQFLLLCLCAVLINTAITPWFILLTIPICAVYYVVQTFFRNTSREIQRIESITNSPVISHFSETIQGVTTIRAFNQEARFMEMLFKRMEANNVAFTIMNCSNRWLGIALDFLGGFIVFAAIVTALATAHFYPDQTASSLVGLAINYTLLVPIYLNWVVKLLADMEMYIGSVERVEYYIESENHENDVVSKPVPISWPQRGDIVFENVTLKYEEQKQSVITNLSLTIPAGQRIGICGRTGSGKSSLALSLFRVLNINEGRILIDDVDIATINLDELRSRLSVIPQDVILFSGTVRENLDPRRHFTDLELWNCLETAQIKPIILAQPNGLDTEIVEGGSNFSAGQRQLFCLARAVLRGSVCLILDEATSSLDTETEKALLKAANEAFQGRTVITIAHRLSTILDYDRVVILENGTIVEDGNPRQLQENKSSKFHEMLAASTNTHSNPG